MKKCTGCSKEYPEDHFSKKGSGRSTRCSRCVAEYFKQYYHGNAERREAQKRRVAKNTEKQRQTNRNIVNAVKSFPCLDCQNSYDPVAMDLDHIHGSKVNNVASMISWPTSRVVEEILKCELVCAVCHRLRTKKRMQ